MMVKPPTMVEQWPNFSVHPGTEFWIAARQIEQFRVEFHLAPDRSPHWPPNMDFKNHLCSLILK